jgi:transposase
METLNLKIHRAYLLKALFRDFWLSATKDAAAKFMKQWFGVAMETKNKPLQDFALLLKRHEENILSYFDMPISNYVVEGPNKKAKVKVINYRACCFRLATSHILNHNNCIGD